jgi:hypothetical protein
MPGRQGFQLPGGLRPLRGPDAPTEDEALMVRVLACRPGTRTISA